LIVIKSDSYTIQTSPATCLTYLTSQVIFVGSHLGDSQLIKIESTPVSAGGEPTLPIPHSVQTVPETYLSSSSKGKVREDSDSTVNGTVVSLQGGHLTALESFKNIAPITDAVLVDPDGSLQVIEQCSSCDEKLLK
jgi:DNA damage-binding protein 1